MNGLCHRLLSHQAVVTVLLTIPLLVTMCVSFPGGVANLFRSSMTHGGAADVRLARNHSAVI